MNLIKGRSGRRAMALVVTLVLVTLTSALVVAYTMRARLDLAASSSYAAVPQADGIARGALEFVFSWLREEIESGSKAYGSSPGSPGVGEPAAYAPLSLENLLPQRSVQRSGGSLPYYQSLLKMSQRSKPFFEAGKGWTYNSSPNFDFASDVSTKEASANGRFIGAGRWLAPGLLTSDEASDFDDKTAKEENIPDWVYVTRQGPTKIAEIDDKQRDDSPDNLDYVMGRFAYAVYDTSGLLDVTIAGYPGDPDDLKTYYGGKGVAAKSSLAWADPSVMSIPGSATGVKRKELVAWRNKGTEGNYDGYVTNALKEGSLTNAPSDNTFFGRSDLVGFAKSSVGRAMLDTNALPYLTVFSREKNAPSWWPSNPASSLGCNIDYETASFDEGTTNRWAAGVLVKQEFTAPAPGKKTFDSGDSEAVRFKTGEPLLKRRFPLSRIDLLQSDSGADRALVQYYFGLVPSGQSLGPVPVWVYRPTGAPGGATGEYPFFKTLDEIAGEGREPNFFELLAAAVFQGSLGKTGQQKTVSNNWEERGIDYRLARDASAYHQILQIGANIIDQYDSDSWPTTIRSVANMQNLPNYRNDLLNAYAGSIRGVENLPYVSMMFSSVVRLLSRDCPAQLNYATGAPYAYSPLGIDSRMQWSRNAEPNQRPWVVQFLHFQMWNPNRNSMDAEPGDYRLIANIGQTYLRPPRGLNGDDFGVPYNNDAFPSEWAVANPGSYRYIHGQRVDRDYFRQTMYPRFGRNFQSDPSEIAFSTAGGKMFQQPRLLKLNDRDYPIDVRNSLDKFTEQGASMAGVRLGETIVMCNLDTDNTNRWDFTRESDSNNDGVVDVGTFGPTVWFNGLYPLVIQLQKKIQGEWVTYWSMVPRRDGNQLNGLPRIDEHHYNWHDSWRLDAAYGRRWPTLSRWCPISDPRCGRFGFTSGGGFDPNPAASRRQQNWAKVGDRTLRYSPEYLADSYKGTINRSSERLDPASGWWCTPWESGPFRPMMRRGSDGFCDQNPEGNSVEKDDDILWYVDGDDNIRSLVAPAELAENSRGQSRMDGQSVMWARDRDGVVRRGDGWRQKGLDPFSMTDPDDPNNNVARPIHLDRPFQSVAELGYVLRDDPWKSLNFFWGDSADAGLLDFFCLYEGEQYRPAVAGVVNPNTAHPEVLKAVLSGTPLSAKLGDEDPPQLSDKTAELIAYAIRAYLGNLDEPANVLRNKGDIVKMTEELFEGAGGSAIRAAVASESGALDGQADTDTAREALVRALADVCNTRTWNLFVDVVAQSGRFTQASRSAKEFLVTGERRLWVQLALDRFTGEVVGVDIEPVFE